MSHRSTQWPSRAPFLHPANELLSPRGESSEERVCADQMCISQMVTGEYVIIPQWRTFPNLAAKAMGEDKVLGSAQSLRVFKFFRGSGSMKETLPPQKGGPEKEGEPRPRWNCLHPQGSGFHRLEFWSTTAMTVKLRDG